MIRSDEEYYSDIKAVLERFYQPGDSLRLVRKFEQPRKCQMCGDKVDIWKCFELQNQRSGQRLICGRHCIVKYANVLRMMNQEPVIVFPKEYKSDADRINSISRNTVTLDDSDFDGTEIEPADYTDWDLCDCNAELTYCPDCDNEVCVECQCGCTCDELDDERDFEDEYDDNDLGRGYDHDEYDDADEDLEDEDECEDMDDDFEDEDDALEDDDDDY